MKYLFLFLGLLIVNIGHSQIGGVTASRLSSISATSMEEKTVEFEPAFSINRAKGKWDNKQKFTKVENDSSIRSSEMGIRVTYSPYKNIEIGAVTNSSVTNYDFGIKYSIALNENNYLAPVAGVNFEMQTNNRPSLLYGLVYTGGVGKLCYDVDFQLQNTEFKNNIFSDFDLGYYFTEEYQLISSFSYYKGYEDEQLGTLSLGATIETGKNFLLVLGVPIDIFGKNIEKTIGFNFA